MHGVPGPMSISIVQDEQHKADGSIVIVRAVQTCLACPSQWDAWDANGQYYYLRWRNERGSVDAFDDKDPSTWGPGQLGTIAHWRGDLPWEDGELQAFCDRAGLTLAPDADVTSWQEYIEQECIEADDKPLMVRPGFLAELRAKDRQPGNGSPFEVLAGYTPTPQPGCECPEDECECGPPLFGPLTGFDLYTIAKYGPPFPPLPPRST